MAKRRNGRGKAKGPNAARAARPAGSSPSELGEGAADVALSGPDASLAPADAARSGLDAGTEPIDPAELIDAAGSAEPADPAGSSSDPAADPDADPDSDSLVLDLEEPDEAFCRHLLENYEWKTTGKRGYDWPRAVERYRSQHPMELEILPSLQETTNFLTGNIEAGVRFSAAMQTLFPVGTSIHGDKAIVAAASKQPKRATRPSRYIGGPTTMAVGLLEHVRRRYRRGRRGRPHGKRSDGVPDGRHLRRSHGPLRLRRSASGEHPVAHR